jgi:PAS domain S-box-containing protein
MASNSPLRLLVTARPADAEALQKTLATHGLAALLELADSLAELRLKLAQANWQVLVAYSGASLSPAQVLNTARELAPGRLVLVVANPASPDEARGLLRAGAHDVIRLEHLDRLPLAIESALQAGGAAAGGEDEYHEMFFRNQAIQLLIDPANGNISDANRAAAQFYGYERSVLRQMSVLQLSLEPRRAAAHLGEVAGGRQGSILTQHRLASGGVRDVEVQSSPVSRAGRTLLYAIVHDVTERLQRERELETVAHFAAVLRKAPTRAAMLPVILEQVQALVGADGAALVLRDSPSGDLVVALAHAWPEPIGTPLSDSSGLASQVVAIGQPEWRVTVPAGAQAAAPLSAQGHALGAVCVSLAAAPTPLQLRLLSAIADMTANALQRATLHEQTEQRLQRLAALHAIDLAITSSFDLRVTLGILLDHLMDQLEVGGAGILLLNAATQTLEYGAVRGLNSALMHQLPVRLSDSLAGRAATTGQPLRIADLASQRTLGGRPYHIGNDKFTSYYGVPLSAKGRVQGVLEILRRGPLPDDPDSREFIDSLATQAAIAIDSAAMFSDLQRSNVDLNLAYDATIEGWSRVLEARGVESPGHTRRVADQTIKLAQAAGFGGIDLVHARRGALLHDIGMLAVPETVLLKPGPLSDAERGVMRQHPDHGFEFLAPINYLRPSLDIPYCHHEKWDGSGYPRGLRGDHIPMAARLFALVDIWDALRADRPFRAAWPAERARAYIHAQSGIEFDPQLTELFMQIATNGRH